MRSLLFALVAVGCASPRPCGGGRICAEVCAEAEAALRAKVPEGGELLTSQEHYALQSALAEVRRGAHAEWGWFGVCRGDEGCAQPNPTPDRPPPGRYSVVAKVLVPSIGSYEVTFSKICKRGEVELSRGGGRIPVVMQPGAKDGMVDLGVLDRFIVTPAPEATKYSSEIDCDYVLSNDEAPGFNLRVRVAFPSSS